MKKNQEEEEDLFNILEEKRLHSDGVERTQDRVEGSKSRVTTSKVEEKCTGDRIQQRAFEQLAGFSEVVEKSVCKVPFLVCQDRVNNRTVEQFARRRVAEQIVDTPALPDVEELVFIAYLRGAGERRSSSVSCRRGAGRRLRRRVTCRRGAGGSLSLRVAMSEYKVLHGRH